MSYLLIGNVSALICEDCTEPLANARIRIYIPGEQYSTSKLERHIFEDHWQLSEREVNAKAERLLAESVLGERGGFNTSWEGLHLFTEPLEMDICLKGAYGWAQYHLCTFVPHWKRNSYLHIGAFAHVMAAEKWKAIRSGFVTPQATGKRRPRLNGWLQDLKHITRPQIHYSDHYVM